MSESISLPNSQTQASPAQGRSPQNGSERPASRATEIWERIDDWCERAGDHFNPILVKETRQALKSRQFLVTFSVLLFSALAWTVVGSLWQMPQIYTTPSAPKLLIGYYIVLAIPMLLVVPLAAYRSLEGEIDDGTLELLSITALSPWQIVLGKLASASLQMMLYFVALFPCMAYAYTLRGVDLPTTLLIVGILLVAALDLTVIALFLAPLSPSRTGRIVTLLMLLVILVLAEYGIGFLVISMILYGFQLPVSMVWFTLVSTLLISITVGHLLVAATAAQLTPESENRSTHLRLSMMVVTSTLLGIAVYSIETMGRNDAEEVFVVATMACGIVWGIGGSLMVSESPVMTPRIRRELPQSFFGRMMLTWLTPGPATGLVFAAVHVVVLTAVAIYGLSEMAATAGPFAARQLQGMTQVAILFAAYWIAALICVRWIVAILRVNNHPRVEIGIAALVAVLVLAALVPYSIGMHLNDYRAYQYSRWQITNWVWTMGEVGNRSGAVGSFDIFLVVAAVAIALIGCLVTMPRVVLPRKTATPDQVVKERQANKAAV
ncbi:ABC-2 family transporter protein [Planctomycetes bacterium CA13]|uniref:ABC-2 family transporter protein n=1 Tax=Novipirellula herctigrandis TaxID=2527986 RepID=A0A5C5YN82_9BACT|nr:ABC-2 family transporter protein [Planctomycetes bacterium CA13]